MSTQVHKKVGTETEPVERLAHIPWPGDSSWEEFVEAVKEAGYEVLMEQPDIGKVLVSFWRTPDWSVDLYGEDHPYRTHDPYAHLMEASA